LQNNHSIFTMLAPINPYAAPPNVHIMESFEVEVDVMDANSPSNSLNTTSSGTAGLHTLGQPTVKPDDPQAMALNNTHQEIIDFSNDSPPLLNRPLTEEVFRTD